VPASVSLGRSADGQTGKVRLIVVDALETTERHKHVEYYGRDAGRFTTDLLKNNRTRLEIQTSPSSRDQHGRLLAFVFCQCDNLLVNRAIIRQGYGHAYTKYPFEPARMKEFRAAEREASQNRRGLWVSRMQSASQKRPCCRRFPLWVMSAGKPGTTRPNAARKTLFLLRSSLETQSSNDRGYGLYIQGSVDSFFVRSRKVICYLLIAAPNSLKDSGVGMDPSRLRAATGGAKGNWERSVYLRKR